MSCVSLGSLFKLSNLMSLTCNRKKIVTSISDGIVKMELNNICKVFSKMPDTQ